MQTESLNHTDRRIRGVSSCINALRENGRPIAGGRFLCAEGQAVPSSRWTGLVEAVTSPDQTVCAQAGLMDGPDERNPPLRR